jgi:hypothetical protein
MFLFKNPNDSNDYIMEVKDINDQNKNKNSDKHYKLLYKFFRGFYGTQIRYLVSKKHRIIFISKGYGQFNKELQEIIIKNNIECEKEMEENNNGGEEILGLKNNRINSKSNKEKEKNNINNNVEKSNGNIDNSNSSDIDDNKNAAYLRQLVLDLRRTLNMIGMDNVFRHKTPYYRIDTSLISCDYLSFLEKGKPAFHGEYMSQYSFAEYTNGQLYAKFKK